MIDWTVRITFTDGPQKERDRAAALVAKLSADLRSCPTVVAVKIDSEPAQD